MTTRTATPATLSSVLSSSTGGDVVELQTGSYGDIDLSGHSFGSAVTIREGSGQTATIETFDFVSCDHITLDGLTIDYPSSPGSTTSGVYVDADSTNIILDNCTVTAPSQATYDEGYAVNIAGTNCTVQDCFIEHWRIAVLQGGTDNTVQRNLFQDIGEDDIKIFGSGQSIIDNMFATRFYPGSGDHPDGIQGVGNFSDITITGNIIMSTVGSRQCIFFGGQFTNNSHTNITIEQNICFGLLNNGISLKADQGHTSSNVSIKHNTVGFQYVNADKKATYISWADATVTKNTIVHNVSAGASATTLSMQNNAPGSPYYVDNYYSDISQNFGTLLTADDFAPVPGALTDPDTYGTSTMGAYDTIERWIANGGVWPPSESVPSSSNNRPLTTGGRILLRGGLPLIAG